MARTSNRMRLHLKKLPSQYSLFIHPASTKVKEIITIKFKKRLKKKLLSKYSKKIEFVWNIFTRNKKDSNKRIKT